MDISAYKKASVSIQERFIF